MAPGKTFIGALITAASSVRLRLTPSAASVAMDVQMKGRAVPLCNIEFGRDPKSSKTIAIELSEWTETEFGSAWNLANEVTLADINPGAAQDVVRCGGVKAKLWR